MRQKSHFGIKALLVATAFVAVVIAWWMDRQSLLKRINDQQMQFEQIASANSALRRSLRKGQAGSDKLFMQVLNQQDKISELEQVARSDSFDTGLERE